MNEVNKSRLFEDKNQIRLKNNLITSKLCDDLKKFANQTKNWSCITFSQNSCLILKTPMYAFVFKIRNSSPIKTKNIRNKLSNGRESLTQNANLYIANQVGDYLDKSYNKLLKKELNKYKNNQVSFFHLVWSLSDIEHNWFHVGVTYTTGHGNQNNSDWYLRLISDRIEINIDEEHTDALGSEISGREEKANIIKVKGSNQFNGDLLLLARHLRKLTQKQLIAAMNAHITQGTLSKIEHGLLEPSQEQVELIASVLKFRKSFFFQHISLYDFAYSFFRSRKSVSIISHKAIQARADLYRLHIHKFLDAIEFEPELEELNKIDFVCTDPSDMANVVKRVWNVPRGPVYNITCMLERAGIIIVPMDFGGANMDGFCHLSCDDLPPIIYINKTLPVDRYRFSLIHELGHLLMHRIPTENQENEANAFAASFLMPDKELQSDFSYGLSIQKFAELKKRWGVSMQALIHKAWSLGKLTDRGLKYYQIELSKRGYRKKEPVELNNFKETPSTLS